MVKKYQPISSKIPKMLHGADYNPEQWLDYPEVFEEDLRLMKLANCNVMSVGIFSWVSLEPEEGKFTFDWMDHVLDKLVESGIYVFLATPSGARPAWMSQKYPEVLITRSNRVRNLHGERHNHCYSSPVYREKVRIMNTKLAERYGNHPAVIGWHISNEYNGGYCNCHYCQENFREWLKERYGSLDRLNHAWWTKFWSHTLTDWSQVESPAPHGENSVHGMNLDWKRFITDLTMDFIENEVAPLRKVNPDIPVTTNYMETFEPLNYYKMSSILDVISWDSYPLWHSEKDDSNIAVWTALNHDMMRSFKGGKPFMLMESTPSQTNWQDVSKLKKPGMHLLSSLQAVAHGSDTIQYFQWRKSRGSSEKFHGAVVDHVGTEHTRVFCDVAKVGETLGELTEVVGTSVETEVAIIFDTENRWAINDSQGPRNMGVHYEQTVLRHYKAFWTLGIPMDVIDMDFDFSKYKVIVAPMLYMVRPGVGERIEKFVENGGTFVATYWSGIVNENDLTFLGGFPGPLRKTLGIWSEEIDGLYDWEKNSVVMSKDNALGLKGSYEAHDLCDLIHTEGAEVLATYGSDFYAGRPAITVNKLGNGKAYYVASRNKEPFYYDFFSKIVKEDNLRPVLDTNLPDGVSVQLRTDGTNDYVFLLNFSAKEQTVLLDDKQYTNIIKGNAEINSVNLAINGVAILKRPSKLTHH
ncbi:beta-galactosidase [Evansella cellulosilytica]|uniref:Beta-galactosidase n=1 Tax=Evansella cellulosilytica (strain ATCC 21833 / DSM 2522 / FERM P-1141 / JCM 9156 / N-4) TaxID=649639 RepID=E6TY00_EVAC2|nr:beta-galactosidase [Evansella cellulosilytica]ADU31213.1 Beta-galactosidase [Evansella cellulosilytica DSM 2522]